MSNVRANSYYDTSGGSNAVLYGVAAPANSMGFRNRIINGDMRIDQRNAGASVTPSTLYNTYTLDRWNTVYSVGSKFSVQQNAGSVTPPSGFKYYLGVTSLSAYTPGSAEQYTLVQNIEGYNVADLGWGAAGAQTVTLSFWVRSSLTGTFGGVLGNSAANRTYPFTYTISAANTWEQKTVTVAGDTTGTWLTTNGIGMQVIFSLGAGSTYLGTAGSWSGSTYTGATGQTNVVATNGATFYITGVQLEAGSVASPFERVDYGRELIMCQRYYLKSYSVGTAPGTNTSTGARSFYATATSGETSGSIVFPVAMRANPTITFYTPAGTSGAIRNESDGTNDTSANASNIGENGVAYIGGSRTANKIYSFQFTASIEL